MKLLIQRLFGIAGFELRKKHGSRASLEGVLTQLHKKGFSPKGIVDVGAAFGDWTRTVHNIFPDAVYVLFEPLTEYAPTLTALSTEYPVSSISVQHTLLGSQSGEGILNVHADLVGSSVYKEVEDDSLLVTEERRLPCTTLDTALRDGAPGPLFLKIDAQGAEQAILSGATSTLARTEVIQLELSLLGSIQGAPLLHEVMAYLAQHGFVPYDFTSFTYRPLDGALAQIDALFVRQDGPFRKDLAFATPEQRRAQNARFSQKARIRLGTSL